MQIDGERQEEWASVTARAAEKRRSSMALLLSASFSLPGMQVESRNWLKPAKSRGVLLKAILPGTGELWRLDQIVNS